MADMEKPRAKAAAAAGKGSGQRPLPTLPANMKTPNNLEFKWSAFDASKLGIWSLAPIPEGTKFGPFQGEKVVTLRKDSDPLCIWEIVDLETKEFLFYCDGTKLEEANWLRHVQCARYYEQQNVYAEQDGIDIIYTTIKPISKGEELLTWYKVPTTRRGQRQAGRESRGRARSIKEMPTMSPAPKSPAPKGSPTTSCTSPKKKPTKVVKSPRTASPLSKPAEIKESPKKEETLKKEEIPSKKEKSSKKDSPKKDESSKKEDISKKKEVAKKEESSKKEEIPKKEETPKKKDTPKKEPSCQKEEITKKQQTPQKKDTPKKEETPQKKDTPKKEESSKKEETPKKQETPQKKELQKKKEETTQQKEENTKKQETPQKKELPKKKEETPQQKEESPKKQLPKKEEPSKKEDTLKKKESSKKGEIDEEAQLLDDRDRDSSDLEMDLDEAEGDEDEDEEDDELDSDGNFIKAEGSKSTTSEDPEKFHFKLKKAHVTKSRHGRKVFKCDICSGIYRHAFSLKRHYIRNHINLKYVSRGDILNCQINPETHDLGTWYSVMDGDSPGPGPTNEKDSDKGSTDSKTGEKDLGNDSGSTPPRVDATTSTGGVTSKGALQKEGPQPAEQLPGSSGQNGESKKEDDDGIERESNDSLIERDLSGLYRCNVCSSCFDTVALLKAHLDNHPNLPSSKAFACDQCDMKFAHKQNLRRHLAVHTGEKPFLCKFCGKMFPTATNQKRHERIHLGRRVACEYCSSTFTQSGDLKKHIRKLHPECFHECAFCGKYFTDEDELIEHVVTHNESMQSNEAERHRRRHAFKVDMELDRIESMKLAEQKTPGVKFACTVCKKRFLDYANMCRHRRLAHQRHLLLGVNGSNSSSPVPSPTKLASDSSDGDPQAFFYANVANNISENLTNYLEGTKEHLEKTANQMKLHNQPNDSTEKVNVITPKVEVDPKDVSYNFPSDFCFKQNYRKVVTDKDKTFDKTKKVKAASNVYDVADLNKPSDSKTSALQGLSSSDLSKNVKVTEVKATEVRTMKVTEPNVNKVNKEEIEVNPVISSMVNGVSLNIPVFNLSNMSTKREIKIQPVCTVQPIQRQSPAASEQKTLETAAAVVQPAKKSVVAANSDNKPTVVPSVSSPTVNKTVVSRVDGTPPPPPTVAAAVKLVTKPPAKAAGTKTSPIGGHKAGSSPPSCLALKIPQVHVCSVCRRLFNNETLFRKHMLDKHKTTPEQSAAAQKEKADAAEVSSLEGSEPVMDLSGKTVAAVSKPSEAPAEKEKAIIDHDEGARLLLDFALGIRDEPRQTPSDESPKSTTEEHFPLDLSAGLPSSDSKSHSKKRTKNQQPKGSHSGSGTTIHPKAAGAQPVAGHCGRVPAAHTGGLNQQGKVQGLLRIPTYHSTKDLDLPAPLASPPGTPRSPWQPQLPISALFGTGPFTKHTTGSRGSGGNKKFICTVCYGEFPSRGSLHNHQRATHNNVRCDHVEVDTDVVAPWWQKPSPVGMLNVCSSQMSEYNQADQEQFKCTKCQKSFKAVEELHGHIFECATPLLKPTKPKLTLLPSPKTIPPSPGPAVCDDTEAAAVAAAGLRLLAAASQPRLPLRDPTPTTPPRPFTVPRLNPASTTMANTTTTGVITGAISSPAASTAPTASMLERFKNSFLKKMKKKKKKREQEDSFGLLTKKRRRSLELLYNPGNHVRRRELTEVVDMQRCQGCRQHFTTISLLERHIPVCTHKDRLKDIKVIRNPLDMLGEQAESRNLCHYCSRQFTYAGMLRKHVFEVCPVRRTRVAEARPLDVTWEQELAQHYSGPASSIDTCSNDGSHVDDTASVATSTSSSHDADQRTRRRKRKNRGWGNGKKKRTSSSTELPLGGFNSDEMLSPDSGTPAPAEDEDDDIDDDLEDGSVSDVEVKKEDTIKTELSTDLGESSQSGDELKIVEDAVVEDKEVPSLVSNISAVKADATVVKSEPKTAPKAEPTMAVKSEPQIKTEPTPGIPPVTKSAPPRETSPKPNSFVGRHALPFVLSIPQYRERTPLTTKPKPNKPLIATTNGSVTVTTSPTTTPEKKPPVEVTKPIAGAIKLLPSEVTKVLPSEKPNMSTVLPALSPAEAAVVGIFGTKDRKAIVSAEKDISSIIRNVEISAIRTHIVRVSPASGTIVCKPPLTSPSFPLNKTLSEISNSVPCRTDILGLVPDKATPVGSGVTGPSTIKVAEQNTNQACTSGSSSDMPATTLKSVADPAVAQKKLSNVMLPQVPKDDAAIKSNQSSAEKANIQQGGINHLTKVVADNPSEVDKPSEVKQSDKLEAKTSPVEVAVTEAIVDKGVSVQNEVVKSDDHQDVKNNSCSASDEQKIPEVKPDQADEDSDESSDEEDIKEIINTVLAQTRQGQKPKTPKLKKQKKAELKKTTVAEKTAKAVKANTVKNTPSKVTPETSEKKSKQTKGKADKDATPKTSKTKTKKKSLVDDSPKQVAKSNLSGKKEEEKSSSDVGKSEAIKPSPKKNKKKPNKDPLQKDEPPNKKKKSSEKETAEKGTPKKDPNNANKVSATNKVNSPSKTPKEKTKKVKQATVADKAEQNASKKADSPTKKATTADSPTKKATDSPTKKATTADSPTKKATTADSPTKKATDSPTKKATTADSPTKKATDSPTKKATTADSPTKKATTADSPTKKATDSPTKKATTADSPTKKATDSPTKKTTNSDSPTKKANSDDAPKKAITADSPTKKATNTDSPTKKATKLDTPTTKKAANSDSPKKVPNKSKPKSTLKKAQCDDSQSDKKDTPSPVKNRKRKVTADPSQSPATPSGKDSPSKTPGGPSPAKLMKTRGGPVAGPTSPPSDSETKKDTPATAAGKVRRVSIRGSRPAEQGSDTKGKVLPKSLLPKSLLSKSTLPKLKRSISASATKKPALGDKAAGKGRGALNGATSMRTRQSRLSL